MNKKNIKLILSIIPILVACSGNVPTYSFDGKLSLVLIDDYRYEVVTSRQELNKNNNHIAYFEKGNDVNFTISVLDGYQLFGTSEDDASIVFLNDNIYSISFYQVTYSTRVSLFFESLNGDSSSSSSFKPDSQSSSYSSSSESSSSAQPQIHNQITYDANGGEYIIVDSYINNKVIYSTAHHPRPNTALGYEIMKREGYLLKGWNTKADLSGEHIGLGSRYLDEQNDSFTLYAEWAKESEHGLFNTSVSNGSCTIKKYKGSESLVVVPETINGYQVTTIANGAFENINIDVVILPPSLKTIENRGFYGCTLKELYFYDDLTTVDDSCFEFCDNLSTIHINAVNRPRYSAADRHSAYADKIDRLILLRNTKKIIVMGGSGAYYNIDACRLYELAPQYQTVNVAINGWFNAQVQFEIIEKYVGQDDLFIHAVESCGEYQLMKRNDMGDFNFNNEFDCRYFNCLELNYDLLALADIRHVTHFFDVYKVYNTTRLTKDPDRYTSYTNFADARGDYSSDPEIRTKYTGPQGPINNEGKIDLEAYSDAGLAELSSYYDAIRNKGATIYFAYSCVNIDSLTEEEKDNQHILSFVSGIESGINFYVTFVNSLFDALCPYDWFADTDWHLDYEHALVFTNSIAEGMGLI